MTLETWNAVFLWASVVFAVLAALSTGTAIMTGHALDTRKDAQIARLEAARQPRHITEQQKSELAKCLRDGPKGELVFTMLSSETDAPEYAEEIHALLSDAGFSVQISDKIWLRLKLGGLYLVAANVHSAPAHAVFIQKCFQAAGIRLSALEDPGFFNEFAPPVATTAAIIVISNRE